MNRLQKYIRKYGTHKRVEQLIERLTIEKRQARKEYARLKAEHKGYHYGSYAILKKSLVLEKEIEMLKELL